ncbi:MAG TPA: hypothetical protein VG819_08445 [Rhizomicrobium sp.]|jgi:hypothetical protein|nr:hypothetical protein [Rhizomicrobium sp.]
MSPTAQHIIWIWFFSVPAFAFGRQVFLDWGKDEATLPIQLFGDTYRKDENYTMYTVAKGTNTGVVVLCIGFIAYNVLQLLLGD